MDKAEPMTNFMQIIPSYEVIWTDVRGNSMMLKCGLDDVQTIVRAVLRTEPTAKIEISQERVGLGIGT